LPWALDIYGAFDYPAEHMDISQTYLHFGAWVESSGANFKDWYSNTGDGYRDDAKIY
jgi:LruC domain-containing protein